MYSSATAPRRGERASADAASSTSEPYVLLIRRQSVRLPCDSATIDTFDPKVSARVAPPAAPAPYQAPYAPPTAAPRPYQAPGFGPTPYPRQPPRTVAPKNSVAGAFEARNRAAAELRRRTFAPKPRTNLQTGLRSPERRAPPTTLTPRTTTPRKLVPEYQQPPKPRNLSRRPPAESFRKRVAKGSTLYQQLQMEHARRSLEASELGAPFVTPACADKVVRSLRNEAPWLRAQFGYYGRPLGERRRRVALYASGPSGTVAVIVSTRWPRGKTGPDWSRVWGLLGGVRPEASKASKELAHWGGDGERRH